MATQKSLLVLNIEGCTICRFRVAKFPSTEDAVPLCTNSICAIRNVSRCVQH